jgi:hypothetical protein
MTMIQNYGTCAVTSLEAMMMDSVVASIHILDQQAKLF